MNLPDLKKLKAIIKLCRSSGVESIEIDGIKITMGAEAVKTTKKAKKVSVPQVEDDIESEDQPSELDMLFWSAPAEAENQQ
jgi:hypothetical protein